MQLKQASSAFILFPLLVLLSAAAWWCIATHRQVTNVLQIMHEEERHLQNTVMADVVKRSIENYCKTHAQETEQAIAHTGTLEAQATVDVYKQKLHFSCAVTKQDGFVVTITQKL